MTQDEWPARVARAVADQVIRYRSKRDLSAQQVADRCEELGHPIQRSVLANFESGRRATITIAELLVLAAALEVPPIALLFPLGEVDQVDVLPGTRLDTEAGMRWFNGVNDAFADTATVQIGQGAYAPESHLYEWYETGYVAAAAPIELFAQHGDLLLEYEAAPIDVLRGLPDDAQPALVRGEVARRRRETERVLRLVRAEMRRRGVQQIPDLPDRLRHLDEPVKKGSRK